MKRDWGLHSACAWMLSRFMCEWVGSYLCCIAGFVLQPCVIHHWAVVPSSHIIWQEQWTSLFSWYHFWPCVPYLQLDWMTAAISWKLPIVILNHLDQSTFLFIRDKEKGSVLAAQCYFNCTKAEGDTTGMSSQMFLDMQLQQNCQGEILSKLITFVQ